VRGGRVRRLGGGAEARGGRAGKPLLPRGLGFRGAAFSSLGGLVPAGSLRKAPRGDERGEGQVFEQKSRGRAAGGGAREPGAGSGIRPRNGEEKSPLGRGGDHLGPDRRSKFIGRGEAFAGEEDPQRSGGSVLGGGGGEETSGPAPHGSRCRLG